MRNLREMNIPADAQVRRGMAEYNAARQQVQEVNRNEPDEAEPGEIREGFERLARKPPERRKRPGTDFSTPFVSFAGPAPCAVIVDSPGGSSVISPFGEKPRTAFRLWPLRPILGVGESCPGPLAPLWRFPWPIARIPRESRPAQLRRARSG